MSSKGHDSRAIANIFVEKFKESSTQLTLLPLVKLVYLAHGWTLGLTDKPLICHPVQAWKYGPVIPEVYHAFNDQRMITEQAGPYYPGFGPGPFYTASLDDNESDIVDKVYIAYSPLSAFQLSDMTHREGTPWDKCNDTVYAPIPNSVIKEYYKKRAAE